jgi:membrane protein YqaA with SNARE-associated domain
LPFLKSLSSKLGHVLALYGGWGLFAMSFLDSSFVPFPGVNDLALIILASRHPARAPFYAFMTTVGSLIGCYVLYGVARGAEKLAEGRSTSTKGTSVLPTKGTSVRRWLERNDFVAMLVMSLLPPPAPLKISVLTAGALRMNALHFGLALLLGRSLRFAAEAWLGARYGAQGEAYIKKNLGWASLVTILIIIGLTLLSRWWKGRRVARRAGSG